MRAKFRLLKEKMIIEIEENDERDYDGEEEESKCDECIDNCNNNTNINIWSSDVCEDIHNSESVILNVDDSDSKNEEFNIINDSYYYF